MSGESSNFPQLQQSKVSPFSLSDKEISAYIIARHNSKAKIQDVDHLYKKVLNIVKEVSSKRIINKHLELKYGESKVSCESNFVPTFHILKDISSQMINKRFDAYTLHETVMWILEKLREYNWAAKGVTALASFALYYGEPWHVFKMAPSKANSLKIHISSGEDLQKPTETIIDYNTLVDLAMQLIEVVIHIEKLIVKNDELEGTAKDKLHKVPLDICTYWAISTLLTCADRMAMDLRSELAQRIGTILNGFASQWKPHIAEVEDYLWRLNVFRSPSGVSQLLTALIFPRDIPYPEIYDNTTKSLVSPHELKTMHLLLFISRIWYDTQGYYELVLNRLLHRIHESFMRDPKKSNYRILWVPVEEYWTEKSKERFNELKSMMPWYIVEYFELIKGYSLIEELLNDSEDLLIKVVDPHGNILHPDAGQMIRNWGDAIAFPFTLEREKQLLEQYGWFWNLLGKATPHDINRWTYYRRYNFVYGGTDEARVKEFAELVETIKRDTMSLSGGDVKINHFNLEEKLEILEEFWDSITTSFQERILNRKDENDRVLLEMEMLLAMKNEKAWALFSKGPLVLVVDYNTLIYEALEEFEYWKENILKQGFDKAFIDYYHMKRSQELERHCYHFQLENLAVAPQNVICPEPDCRLKMKMEIKSIKYTCCHEKLNQCLKGVSKKRVDEATLQS